MNLDILVVVGWKAEDELIWAAGNAQDHMECGNRNLHDDALCNSKECGTYEQPISVNPNIFSAWIDSLYD